MTDQTQTTTEPVDSSHGSVYDQLLTLIHDRDHALRGDERTDPNEIDETVLEIMRITTPQPLAIGLDREAVARVIEPAAFLFTADELGTKDYNHPTLAAYRKADAIIALAAPAEGYVLVPVEAVQPFIDVLVDIGESEADEDTFRNANRYTAKAAAINVGHVRRLAAITRADGGGA